MPDKLKFIACVVGAVVICYLIIGVTIGFVSEIAFDTANNTSVAAFGSAQAFLRWVPILLYILPGLIGTGLIVWKLRKPEEN